MLDVASFRSRQRTRTLASVLVLFVVLVAAQIAIPLADSAVVTLTTAVVVTLATATSVLATLNLKMKQISEIFVFTVAATFLVEVVGTRTGLPFGDYSYGPGLRPQLFSVPVIIPLAWFAMALPAWEIGRRLFSRTWQQCVAGGFLLAAWDLLLDPQMVHHHFWNWHSKGAWHGIPMSNYIGWGIAGAALCAAYSWAARKATPNPWLVLPFLWMGFFTAFGFLLPFVFDAPSIGIIGGLLTVVPALLALRTYERPWLR